MPETLKTLIANQLNAALCTLSTCIDRCPDTVWGMRIANLRFCQVAFHTLFYADYYLEPDDKSFRLQRFHRDNAEAFDDYEELEDRAPVHLYERTFIQDYVQHFRRKASEGIASETADSLSGPCGCARLKLSRSELYVYITRHIQHHAAQLTLRLRLETDVDIPWFASGWREV